MRAIPDRPSPSWCGNEECAGWEVEAYRMDPRYSQRQGEQPVYRGYIAYYRCPTCKKVSRRELATFGRPEWEHIPEQGQFFAGPFLLAASPLEKTIQVSKHFDLPALWTALAENPNDFYVRRIGRTKNRDGYMIVRDPTTWWRGRGLQFDALWAFWRGR